MSKLWSKGYTLNKLVEKFTVGNDYILDRRLVPADIMGSLAHASMLNSINLLTDDQFGVLKKGLLQILKEYEEGVFQINLSDEDSHTAIENRLVELTGDSGKRIHLGRSRNDQALTVMRLWMRHALFLLVDEGGKFLTTLLKFARANSKVPMPGRTHMQVAMPSTVGLWAGGFAEQTLDDIQGIADLYPYFDQCPLGSGAGYGVPLPLNRELTARLLGFSRVQNNVTYGGLCRGKFESRLIDASDQIAITLSKFATDLILFSLPEFGWFSLPQDLCTGSSIMPQKRNPDALELMRAKAASVGSYSSQVKNIIRALPSGYNRDYQDTKEPVLKTIDTTLAMLKVAELTIAKLSVHEKKLQESFNDEIFATDSAIDLVSKGASFRDAYREVGMHPEKYSGKEIHVAISKRTSTGAPGNPCFETAQLSLEGTLKKMQKIRDSVENSFTNLAGQAINIFLTP